MSAESREFLPGEYENFVGKIMTGTELLTSEGGGGFYFTGREIPFQLPSEFNTATNNYNYLQHACESSGPII